MYKFIILAVIFGIGVQIPSELPTPAVNGIQLNDNTETVLLALGNPNDQDQYIYNTCDPESNNMQWHYPGMSITFTEYHKQPMVSQIVIYDGKWALGGIHLQDDVQQVKALFGDANFIHDVLPYNNRGDASWEFTIRHNQVANIALKQASCKSTV
ncbi:MULTISPECIES: hypothetical protein [Vitreoscilla]|uniref:Uncharacterized protein n=1 Tax=Vitreoscilla stercoraria TaxID=61 RepID=A0ABY4EBY7_VITST|nr:MULTISPECIES: hypothetical protein [Vitreoscilla]AUZ05433.1 hypothetical protein ADP71_19570 [Vitreoscilla sp. C1]UOO93265.1 hypothetical protein LVJ81_04330 [Vitreoscilla stercoraria]